MIPSLQKTITSSLKIAELILFPSYCRLCSSLLESPKEKIVCRSCLERIRSECAPCCLCCGRFFHDTGEPHLCRECIQKRPFFSLHRSCGRYQTVLKDVILLFKYGKFSILGNYLGQFVYTTLREEEALWWEAEVIVPVPLHIKRERQRGFNQAQIIAKELARLKGIELVERSLIREKNVLPQTSLEAKDRQKNVRGAFGIRKSDKIKGKVVILVDDVFTTGATIRECSAVLIKAGSREVRAVTVAQA